MAEEKRDALRIHLHVYDEEIEVMVHDRAEEEYFRAAAKLITDRYNVYAHTYKGHKSDHTISLMTLVDIALRYEKSVPGTIRTLIIIFSEVLLRKSKKPSVRNK